MAKRLTEDGVLPGQMCFFDEGGIGHANTR